jgi:medium-chain acyl-[acyl-carrier-protein] hydrolase
MAEPPYTGIAPLVEELAGALSAYDDRPLALFGHSVGALVAYAVARSLFAANRPPPVHLFAAARPAPQRSRPYSPIHHLPDFMFVAALRSRIDGIPQAILDEPEMLKLFLPAIRADLRVNESYRPEDARPIPCPITAFGGVDDRAVFPEQLSAWGEMTQASFRIELFPGGHFFPQTAPTALLSSIERDLDAAVIPGSGPR